MPKRVDHDERRSTIAEALWRIAASRGLHAVSFREVAAEAGVSVALVQHYFGSRRELLAWSVNHQTARLGAAIVARTGALGPERTPRDLLTVILESFLPLDEERRLSMLVYHAFAAAAASDHTLMTPELAAGGRGFIDAIAGVLGGIEPPPADVAIEAMGLVSMILGLSLAMLMGQTPAPEALAVVHHHVDRLC